MNGLLARKIVQFSWLIPFDKFMAVKKELLFPSSDSVLIVYLDVFCIV
jgi:hypothetical protein